MQTNAYTLFYSHSTLFLTLELFSHKQLTVGKGADGFTAISKISVARVCVWPRREEINVYWNSQNHAVCIIPSCCTVFLFIIYFSDMFHH